MKFIECHLRGSLSLMSVPDVSNEGGLSCHDVCFYLMFLLECGLFCHDVCFFLMFLLRVISSVMMSVFS